jgi:signal transduction histidine kinase
VAVVRSNDLRVLAMNDVMSRPFRRAVPDAVGLSISNLLPAAHPLADPGTYRAVAANSQPFESTAVLDGRTWQMFVRPLQGENRSVEHFLVGLVEIPASPAESDVARLRETNAAKTEFLNMAAHELRTPMSVIHGYGSLLAQGGLSPEHQKLAGLRIYEKARQLSRLIADMGLVARFDELGPDMPRHDVDLVALLEGMVKDLQRRFADLAVDLQLSELTAPVKGNAYWLGLALRELLDNAIRFRPGPTGRIDIGVNRSDDRWVVSILDDGFGIAPADHGRLFKRFARIETEDNHHLVGLGIGLYIVQEVARAHGGRVMVNSRPGTGSEFTLELPARR